MTAATPKLPVDIVDPGADCCWCLAAIVTIPLDMLLTVLRLLKLVC